MDACITAHPAGVVLTVIVTPRAGQTGIARIAAGAVHIRLAAAPVDGAANAALVRFLAECFDLPRAEVELLAGAASRWKRVLLRGIERPAVVARLAPYR